jgi:hypothetical protein
MAPVRWRGARLVRLAGLQHLRQLRKDGIKRNDGRTALAANGVTESISECVRHV